MTTTKKIQLIRQNNIQTFLGENDSLDNYTDIVEVKEIEVIIADNNKTFFKDNEDHGTEVWLFVDSADDYTELDIQNMT